MSATIGKVKRPSVCKGRSVVTLVVVLLSGAGTAVQVAADWGVTIGASVSATQVYGDTAEAAFAPGATDGFDTYAVDQPEAPAPPQGVRVYFPHPEWKSDTQPVELFTRDAGRPLPDCSARIWAFTVESVDLAGDVSLVFDLSTLPADHTATLTDVTTGEQYDLRSGGYPGFAITAGGTRQFALRSGARVGDHGPDGDGRGEERRWAASGGDADGVLGEADLGSPAAGEGQPRVADERAGRR